MFVCLCVCPGRLHSYGGAPPDQNGSLLSVRAPISALCIRGQNYNVTLMKSCSLDNKRTPLPQTPSRRSATPCRSNVELAARDIDMFLREKLEWARGAHIPAIGWRPRCEL